ncbi:MAG: multicopper oxidase family protein [Crocinitomicaceae bacterium]
MKYTISFFVLLSALSTLAQGEVKPILKLADVKDSVDAVTFFKIPELRSKNGELVVDLYVQEKEYYIQNDLVKMRTYVYEVDGKKSDVFGPWGPTLRIGKNDRLSVTVHNQLPVESKLDYLMSLSLDFDEVIYEGPIHSSLATEIVRETQGLLDGGVSFGHLSGATLEEVDDDVWRIHGRQPCPCAPGLEGSCTKVPIDYVLKKEFNRGSKEEVFRLYLDHSEHAEDHTRPHNFNTTNLHTHGFHVSPFQDDIFREIPPGNSSYYTYDLDEHTSGTMWYHPHVHGSTGLQVASGMSGVLIVEDGDLSGFPELKEASMPEHERVLLINQIVYDPDLLELPNFETLRRVFSPPHGTTVNGVIRPELAIAPGEVQRWRMVHSGYRSLLGLEFDPRIEVMQISVDGIYFDTPRKIHSLHMAPGNRSDILIRVKEDVPPNALLQVKSIEYNPNCEYFPEYDYCKNIADAKSESMIQLLVTETPMSMKFPSILPKRGMDLDEDISKKELVNASRPRKTTFDVVASTVTENAKIWVNGKTFEPDTVHEILPFGKAEAWHVTSDRFGHPYHIHINPFQVVEFGGVKLPKPIWKDVVLVEPNFDAMLRTRYLDFWGDFVLHCHILVHEDQGMMQRISIRRP